LGSVSIDIHKKEREFQHFTLSDENVLKYLILSRSTIDVGYGASTNINIYQAGDTFDFNSEIIAMYASLDKVIEKIEFDEKELQFIKLLFDGNSIRDVINVHKIYKRATAYRVFDRIVNKISDENFSDWKNLLTEVLLKGGR
jgi:hypothetical protein